MALNKQKTDPELGKKVEDHLKGLGLQTPTTVFNDEDPEDQKAKLTDIFKEALQNLGLDLQDDSLRDTPRRIAKMYIDEIFYGLKINNFPKITTIENKMKYDELLVERDINTQSNCEHHFVVIDGKTHIGYIPNEKVIGLSKLNRIVEYFAKRPQVQERLTAQIHATLCLLLETEDVAVVIDGVHFCVKSRGIEDTSSSTSTSKMSGRFRSNSDLRNEFLNRISAPR